MRWDLLWRWWYCLGRQQFPEVSVPCAVFERYLLNHRDRIGEASDSSALVVGQAYLVAGCAGKSERRVLRTAPPANFERPDARVGPAAAGDSVQPARSASAGGGLSGKLVLRYAEESGSTAGEVVAQRRSGPLLSGQLQAICDCRRRKTRAGAMARGVRPARDDGGARVGCGARQLTWINRWDYLDIRELFHVPASGSMLPVDRDRFAAADDAKTDGQGTPDLRADREPAGCIDRGSAGAVPFRAASGGVLFLRLVVGGRSVAGGGAPPRSGGHVRGVAATDGPGGAGEKRTGNLQDMKEWQERHLAPQGERMPMEI